MLNVRRFNQWHLQAKKVIFLLKNSIIKRLLVVVFSIYMVLTIIVTLVHMNYEYEFSKQHTIEALRNVQQMVYSSVSQAIWEFNGQQLDTIINGLYNNQYVVGVKLEIARNEKIAKFEDKAIGFVENYNGQIIYVDPRTGHESKLHDSFTRLIPNEFSITHVDPFGRNITIGKMSLYSSNKIVFMQVKDSYILLIVNAIIKTIALWIFFLWAGYYFVSKPLAQLNESIKQLASGNWNAELTIKQIKEHRKTEINTLFETFNNMIRNLHAAQDKLNYSRNRLNNIFDTMPSALMAVNNNGVIHNWNRTMAILTGVDVRFAHNRKLTEVYPQFVELEPLIRNALYFNQQQQVKNAKIFDAHSNKTRLYDIIVYPLHSVFPPEVVIRIDDVTEEEKNEAKLAQVEKLASVGASIAGVTHEINNPLGSIMQSCQNIQRRIDPSREANITVANELGIDLTKQYEYLEKREITKFLNDISVAGQRASSIVKNMLQFTRRSASEMSIHSVQQLIDSSIQLAATDYALQEHYDFKSIHLDKKLPTTDIEIECHPMEIQQVLLNLIKNAVQAFNQNQDNKVIIISVKPIEDNKLQIDVSDNGRGMSPEILEQIFHPFFTTKPVGEGTGLGLSVCRNIIVQKHHGTMDVKSQAGVGTTFTLVLPIKQP